MIFDDSQLIHIIASFVLLMTFRLILPKNYIGFILAILITFIIGIGKEWYDITFDKIDLVSNVIGILIGGLL